MNINPIQSIQTDYLPSFISYLWPLVHDGHHLWAVDHPTSKETISIPFVMKYDLLIWNIFYRSSLVSPSIRGDLVYPKVLILAPDWSTCETTYKHLSNVHTDQLKKIQICCIYEGQNSPDDLYKSFMTHGCDLLITTPEILHDLIQQRHIHFEQLQMIVYDQIDNLVQTNDHLREFFHHLDLHHPSSIQHLFFSRIVNQMSKDFLDEYLPKYSFLSSSMLETYSYQNNFVYCEPCRNWTERKHLIQQILDLASRCQKKVVICANHARRLTTMQSILNDHSIQSIYIHSQLSSNEIDQYINEWQTISDRPFVLLIQDDVLQEISIDNADILIHLDVQRLIWYYLYNQRLKLIYKSLSEHHSTKKPHFTSLKSIEQFYQMNNSSTIPLIVLLWPGDCAQVTYELIYYLNHSQSYIHPLIERLAKNNCHETIQSKLDVEFCPTLKSFGRCLNEKKLKRCPYRHQFHYELDLIELRPTDETKINANLLSNSFELYLPDQGEIELQITHVSDENRLYGHVLRSRTETNEPLKKIFDYERFDEQISNAFEQIKHRPLNEIVPGEIYFYCDENNRVHRVYVSEQERNYFDLRRTDAIRNRVWKFAQMENNQQIETNSTSTTLIPHSSTMTNDRSSFTVFSLDTGITLTLKSNEYLYPIEPVTLKQYPPLAIEIVLCNIRPLNTIHMTFTPFTIETVRSLTLNEIFMGRIQLATRSCLWIDPLVKPVRLASLKRIVYDKPIRKQLILSKLVESNDDHIVELERLAVEAQLKEPTLPPKEEEEENPSVFQPFLNRRGQLIINPLGRSKEFFARHQHSFGNDPVRPSLNLEQSLINNTSDSKVTTPSEIGTTKMNELITNSEVIREETTEVNI